MKLRCIDNSFVPRGESLTLDRVYEIDPRRDVETNIKDERYFFVNGRRYGAWRFEKLCGSARPIERTESAA